MHHPYLGTLLASVLLCAPCTPGGPEQPPAPACQSVSIELLAGVFRSAGYVRATLASKGPQFIYFWPPGPRVQRKQADMWTPNVQESHPPGTPARPIVYDFANPRLIGLRWRDVATDESDDSYLIPAGSYRLVLFYTTEDPRADKASNRSWCKATSGDFVLEHDGRAYATQ